MVRSIQHDSDSGLKYNFRGPRTSTEKEGDLKPELDSDLDHDDDGDLSVPIPIKQEKLVPKVEPDDSSEGESEAEGKNGGGSGTSAEVEFSKVKCQVIHYDSVEEEDDVQEDEEDEVVVVEERESPLPSPTTPGGGTVPTIEIILSDDDAEDIDSGNGGSSALNSSNSSEEEVTANGDPPARAGLRRKRKVNYSELETGGDDPDRADMHIDKQGLKKETFDVFSLPTQKLMRFIQNPELVDNYTRCTLNFMDGTDTEKINAVRDLFENYGPQFEAMHIHIRYNQENFPFLKTVFQSTTALGKLSYKYQNREDAYQILELLKSLREQDHLKGLHSLKLVGLSGKETLTEKHLELLSEMKVPFQKVELGDGLWENVKSATLGKFLENQKTSLESLIIHGGFRGDMDKEKIVINFPRMEKLKTLWICPSYTFLSEMQNPVSKKNKNPESPQVIEIDLASNREEPFKIAIKFSSDLPALEGLVLGNLIEIEELRFSSIRKLIEFRCGSYWNLPLRFPTPVSRKVLTESSITSLQFPDGLKDPSFPLKVAKHFPHLKKVWMSLPSVPVLRAFFKAFEHSNLEELSLKTQFDFQSTLESCLLPGLSDIRRRYKATEALLKTLKEYKHFKEYVRYYNVELPVEAENLMEGHSAGIGSLKNLKVLHLEHIPRKLLIPVNERKWYDHNCKFMSRTFGYEQYPITYQCHQEILKLGLNKYTWKNIQNNHVFVKNFNKAGFVDVDADEEDLFTPVKKAKTNGPQVTIAPSMLLPDVKIKPEQGN